MRRLLSISILFLFTHILKAQDCELQFNGAYICLTEGGEQGFNEFIRFYDDGEVITAVSVFDISQSVSWFHNDDPGVSQGSYEQVGCDIRFSTRSGESKYYYDGFIDGDFLSLKVLYPGRKEKEMVELMFEFKKIHLK